MPARLVGSCIVLAGILLQGAGRAAEPVPVVSATQRGASRNVLGYDPTPNFVRFDADYRQKHATYAQQLRELQLELARQTSNGRATPCSRQIFLEARWLVYYSAHWARIERRLADLREMLRRPSDPPDARQQLEADGSYDHCSQAWFLKLDSTIEEVEDRHVGRLARRLALSAKKTFLIAHVEVAAVQHLHNGRNEPAPIQGFDRGCFKLRH